MRRGIGWWPSIALAMRLGVGCGSSTPSVALDAATSDGTSPGSCVVGASDGAIDSGTPAEAGDAASDAPTVECSANSQCGPGETCLFAVGDCSAKGQCLIVGSLGAQCNLAVNYCGCDGTSVRGLCGPPYAAGPTRGIHAPCGPPVTLASGRALTTLATPGWRSLPAFIAVDPASVYWTNSASGTVMKVPKCGGPPVTLASGVQKPEGIAVDATSVYFAVEGQPNGSIAKVGLDGGAVAPLAEGPGIPYEIALDASFVYWTDIGNDPGVMRVAIAGGTPTRLASGRAWAIAVDATSVYWTEGSSVVRAPKGGGSPATLASGQGFPYGLALDSTSVYWTNNTGGGVMKAPIAGGTPTTLAFTSMPEGIAVDDTNVYWTNNISGNAGTVASVPKGGGSTLTLVTGQTTPQGIAVDPASIYWVDTGLGAVMRLAPK